MKSARSIWIFVALVFLVPVMAYALVSWYQDKYERLPVYSSSSNNNENVLTQLSSFNLLNQDGKKPDESEWNKKILIADFFFTHCPSICPKMTAGLKEINEAFEDNESVEIASFTVDPERDSIAQLKKYASQFNLNTSHWNFITGDKKDIYKLARNGFKIVASEGDGGPYDFIHSDKFVLVDKKKNIRGYYDGTKKDEIKKLISDIKKLEHE